jgi:geranylgeranyl pyrophosphate synthase
VLTVDPATAPDIVQRFLQAVRPDIDATIAAYIGAPEGGPGRLREAMHYAALGPGKRLRPAMTIAACVAAGGTRAQALPAAAAVEMLHAYTLVHDDLPAMDDDDTRRGRPTVHIEFGEALAVLCGDALLTGAFEALTRLDRGAGDAVAVLARRSGAEQLIGGQVLDLALAAAPDNAEFAALEEVHRRKTGALFAAAAELGGIAAGADADARAALARYGMAVGVAFQYADDRDDDEYRQHRERGRERMRELTGEAAQIAAGFGDAGQQLHALAVWIASVA